MDLCLAVQEQKQSLRRQPLTGGIFNLYVEERFLNSIQIVYKYDSHWAYFNFIQECSLLSSL